MQHGQAGRIEVFDHIAYRLVVAAKLQGYCGSTFSARTGQQDLATAQDKGIGRTQSFLDLAVFVFGKRSDKNGWSHTLYCTTFPITFGVYALGCISWGFTGSTRRSRHCYMASEKTQRLSHQRSRTGARMTGVLHEVSCGCPASRAMKRLGKDTYKGMSFPNCPVKWREMSLQAVSAKLLLTLAMPAAITLATAFLVDHCVAPTLRTKIASDAQIAQTECRRPII